jgi:hypothetical protein
MTDFFRFRINERLVGVKGVSVDFDSFCCEQTDNDTDDNSHRLPLCVDLDVTLIGGDITANAIKQYINAGLFNIFKICIWYSKGIAYMKRMLANSVKLNVGTLDYNENFLQFLVQKKADGYKLFLVTASDKIYANRVAKFLKIFDGVFASDGKTNLRAEAKANLLVTVFGEKKFIYAGNSVDDISVWKKSAIPIMVTPTKSAIRKMKGINHFLFE